MTELKERGVSERQSCALVSLSRSSYRYEPVSREDDRELAARLHSIAEEHPAAGYRMAWAYLRREGVRVNHKRVYRVWREEGLSLPRPRRRRKRKQGAVPLEALHVNHVWTYDLVHDRTLHGQPLRFLTLEDEYTREGLAIEVDRSLPANRVIEVLERVIAERGAPEYLRSDNGPEFIAQELSNWLQGREVETHHIDPGSPWQNAYGESFNATLRRECLSQEVLHSLREARLVTELWRRWYNEERPHSSLGYLTPVEFRKGLRIALLERGRPSSSCANGRRGLEQGLVDLKSPSSQKAARERIIDASLYLPVVQI